jgi:hypothetical protein
MFRGKQLLFARDALLLERNRLGTVLDPVKMIKFQAFENQGAKKGGRQLPRTL